MWKAGIIDRYTYNTIRNYQKSNSSSGSVSSVDEALIRELQEKGLITEAQRNAMLDYLNQQQSQTDQTHNADESTQS